MKKSGKIITVISIISILITPFTNVSAKTKNETVYTNLDSYGNVKKSSITNHLFINEKSQIEDETELKEILNINGEESYQINEKGITWNTFGKDIFYRGVIEKTLPIEVKVKYYLDDVEQDVKEMSGKSGKIRVQMDFQNNVKSQVKVNGVNTTLYTPFVVTMGLILNNEDHTNIKINNGKIIDSGTRNIVLGIASPGMYENFKINELKSLDKIILEYETTNFSLGDIYMVATPKLLEETDLKMLNQVNILSKSMNTLQSSIDEIEKGAKKLEDGSNTLSISTTELVKGLKVALDGVSQLESGSVQISTGLKEMITKLQGVSVSLNTGSISNLQVLIEKNNTAKDSLVAQTGMDYNSLMSYYQTNLVNYVGTDQTLLTLKSTCELILLLDANNQAITQTLTIVTSIDHQIKNLLTTLTNTLAELEKGSQQISVGLMEVKTGLESLYTGSQELNNGTKSLKEGMNGLSIGIQKFNQEGIHTLTNSVKTLQNYSNKVEALINLSEDYHGYASNNADATILVYMIKSPKK